jgi:hypothetical protein
MKGKDAMHKGVDWVSPDTPVAELPKLMYEHTILPLFRLERTTVSLVW